MSSQALTKAAGCARMQKMRKVCHSNVWFFLFQYSRFSIIRIPIIRILNYPNAWHRKFFTLKFSTRKRSHGRFQIYGIAKRVSIWRWPQDWAQDKVAIVVHCLQSGRNCFEHWTEVRNYWFVARRSVLYHHFGVAWNQSVNNYWHQKAGRKAKKL